MVLREKCGKSKYIPRTKRRINGHGQLANVRNNNADIFITDSRVCQKVPGPNNLPVGLVKYDPRELVEELKILFQKS